jgi:NAD(P)-dependent dehydrogenase (short-subunit alcohol dehydrogenase family)
MAKPRPPSKPPLAGHVALVTGSGQNIGKAIAIALAAQGASVVINGHSHKARVDAVVREIRDAGGEAIGIMADVGDANAVTSMVRKAEKAFGTVDIAVSNVSIRRLQPFLDISVDDWNGTLNSNLNSCFYLARAVVPGMKQKGYGRIIHISGVDGFAGHIATRAHNIVAKAGMHAFAKALAVEFGEFGITANTVSPGAMDTARDWTQYPANWKEMRLKQIPVKRLGRVEEIASACTYLCGEDAGFVTGQVIHVNGGQYMY